MQDGLVVGLFAASVDANARLWGVPYVWYELLHSRRSAVPSACGLYIGAVVCGMARWREHIWHRAGIFLFLLPFLFNQLLLLGSTPRIEELGWRLVLMADIGVEVWRIIGRTAVLLLFTEVLLVGVGFVMDRRWAEGMAAAPACSSAASLAAASPPIADLGSTGAGWLVPPDPPSPLAALAFAGLWGQTFLVTGVLLDAFRNRRPSWRLSARHWRSGAVKGAIYAGLFMALVQICAIVADSPRPGRHGPPRPAAGGHAARRPCCSRCCAPSSRASTAARPFFRRLLAHGSHPWSYVSGIMLGLGVGLAFSHGPSRSGTRHTLPVRRSSSAPSPMPASTSPAICGPSPRTSAGRPQDWRVYALGAAARWRRRRRHRLVSRYRRSWR